MAKTDFLNMRINPETKSEVDNILKQLGLTTTEAINIFLNQVILKGGLPFEVILPKFNEETKKSIEDSENNKNIQSFKNSNELFKELGI